MGQLEEENDKLNEIVQLKDAEIAKLRQGAHGTDPVNTLT